MKTAAGHRPVDIALTGYENLIRQMRGRSSTAFPAEKELASRWGVSQSAVNRAALRLIAAGRLRRLGYKLTPAAAEPDTGTLAGARLAVLTHRTARLVGLAEEATKRGVQVEEIFCIGRDTFHHNLRLAAQKRLDGVIFRLLSESGWEWDNEAAEFDRLRIPYIVCEEAPPGHNLVTEDLHGATASLVAHLTSLGHSSIVYLGSMRQAHRSIAIRQAYEETCLRLGLHDSARQAYELSAHTREVVRLTLRRIRSELPAATAVVFFDADPIETFLAAARLEQVNVPQDLSLVTVGDSAITRNCQPPVTCVGFDSRTLGHMALDLICQNMLEVRRTGRLLPRQRLRIEGTLRQRSSVAARASIEAVGADGARSPEGSTSQRLVPDARTTRAGGEGKLAAAAPAGHRGAAGYAGAA